MNMLHRISKRKFIKADNREVYFIEKDGKNLRILSMLSHDSLQQILSFADGVPFDIEKDLILNAADLFYNLADCLSKKCQSYKGKKYITTVEPDARKEFYSECKSASKYRIPIYTLSCRELHIGACNYFDRVKHPFILMINR